MHLYINRAKSATRESENTSSVPCAIWQLNQPNIIPNCIGKHLQFIFLKGCGVLKLCHIFN